MKIGRFFLLGIFCLLLINYTQGMETDLEKGEGTHSPISMYSVQAATVTVNIGSSESDTKQSSWAPMAKTIAGSFLSISGYALMGAGGVMADVSPDAMAISGTLLGVGGLARQAGGIFFNLAEENEVQLAELDGHVAKAQSGTLSAAEIQGLSDQFLAKNKTYQQLYFKQGLCLDGICGTICDLVGIPVGLVGTGFVLSGDRTVGPSLMAAGAAVHDLGGWFKSRATTLKAQKDRIDIINQAKEKAEVH